MDALSKKLAASRSKNTELELLVRDKEYKIGVLEREIGRTFGPKDDSDRSKNDVSMLRRSLHACSEQRGFRRVVKGSDKNLGDLD